MPTFEMVLSWMFLVQHNQNILLCFAVSHFEVLPNHANSRLVGSYSLNKVFIPRSKRFNRSSIVYCVNDDASFQLERVKLSGDVNPNPGPHSLQNHEININVSEIIPEKDFKIGHWNINNLTDAKLEQIKLIMAPGSEVDVLFLIETFLKPTKPNDVLEIPGYMLFRKDRAGPKKGGGILVYVTNSIKASRVMSLEESDLEILWLQVTPYKSKRPILVGGVYRPPSTTADVDTRLELNIETTYLINQEMHVLGDFNIDYLDINSYNKHRLVKGLKSLNLKQVVKTVTRPASSTCIDHVYTTHQAYIADIIVLNIGLADHLPIFIRRKYCRIQKGSEHNTIQYRDFKNINNDNLLHDLENASWDTAFELNDVNQVLNSIELMLNEILERYIPLKTKRVKRPCQPDWMTKELLTLIRTRDQLLLKARKSNQPEHWAHYTCAKCKTTNAIKKAKRDYFRTKIDENKENPKGIWSALKALSGTSKLRTKIKELELEYGTICDERSIANELNSYFTNIVEQIEEEKSPESKEFDDSKLRDFISTRLTVGTTFTIPEISLEQFGDIIRTIPINKATGYDGISARVCKLITPVMNGTLCKLLNLSIRTNTFPDRWKIGQITPLYKGGSPIDRNNYRRISVLPVLSKIFERHVSNAFLKYLQENNLLYELQLGFRSGHSTETALIRITDEILLNMDKDEVTGLVFIDFRKVFDVIDHELLLKKLAIYGVSSESVTWFRSYLEGRRQSVKLGASTSEKLPVKRGVPQGSVLGSVLFLLFVNDMPLYLEKSTIDIYADDTTLSLSSSWENISSLSQALTKDLKDVNNWSKENKMYIIPMKRKQCSQ